MTTLIDGPDDWDGWDDDEDILTGSDDSVGDSPVSDLADEGNAGPEEPGSHSDDGEYIVVFRAGPGGKLVRHEVEI